MSAQEHFRKLLSVKTGCGYIYICKLRLYHAKRETDINDMSNFSNLGLTDPGLTESERVCCGLMTPQLTLL